MAILSDKQIIDQFYGGKVGIKKVKGHKTLAERGLSNQKKIAREDFQFYAGDKMYYSMNVNDAFRKRMVVFNKVKPVVDPVQGFMMQNRRQTEYIARMRNNQQQVAYSEYMNGVVSYARDNADVEQVESHQDLDMLICGYGATDANINYFKNPDGEYEKERVSPFDIWWDPQSRKTNLLDARFVYRTKKLSLDEAMDLFDRPEEDFQESDDGQSSGGFEYYPQGGIVDKISFDTDSTNSDVVNVHYYQWFEYEDYWRIDNPAYELGGVAGMQLIQAMEFIKSVREDEADENEIDDIFSFDPSAQKLVVSADLKRDLNELFGRVGVSVSWKDSKYKRKAYYTAVLSGKHVFDKFRSPDQTGFTIKFKTASWDEENKRWFGMVAMLKEPARYSNKALTEMIYVIAANSKGGVMYEDGAVDNPARFETQYARNDSAIKVNNGALSSGKIQPKAQPHLPNGYEEIKANADQAIFEISPVNAEFMGKSNNPQVSAALERQRIKQVTTTLAPLFDAISLYQKEDARQMVSFVKILAQNSQDRLVRIVGKDGASQFVQMLEDNFADEYDVVIGEMPTTSMQREQTEGIMLKLAQEMGMLGVNIYPTAIKYINGIKEADKQEIIKKLEPQPPTPEQLQAQQAAQRMAQQVAEVDLAARIANIEETKADTQKRLAEAAKTAAQVEQVEVETDQTTLENINLVNRPVDEFNLTI